MAKLEREDIGAWVLKCNPKVWDVVQFMDGGGEWLDIWSVGRTYRNELIRPGDKVLLWVGGSRPNEIEPGFWGAGIITGSVYPTVETEDGLWLDRAVSGRVEHAVQVSIDLWDSPISRERVRLDPRVDAIEVLRAQQGSNPSYLSPSEFEAIESLMPVSVEPEHVPTEVTDVDDLVDTPDPVTRAIIERAGIEAVWLFLEDAGFSVEDVQSRNLGWDLTALGPDGESHVEVKARARADLDVLLSPNELRAAQEDEAWELAIVTEALDSPVITWFAAADVTTVAKPALYRFKV